MDPEPDEEAAALVGDLVQAARVPAKRRPFPVRPTIERLVSLAYEYGVQPDTLRSLVLDVLTVPGGGYLDQASLGALARNLYPAVARWGVSEEVVLAIINCLGQGQLKAPLVVQALLLRWLVLVYHSFGSEPAAALSRSYGVIFNLLDTAAIRPQLCHLLVLITRRKHVRPFRIQAILHLSRQVGHDQYLVGLLRVFKNYYPEVIVAEATRGRASAFKHPDPQWLGRLNEIQLARRQNQLAMASGNENTIGNLFSTSVDELQNGFRVRQGMEFIGASTAVAAAASNTGISLPIVHTSHVQEESVTLEEIDSATGLVQNFDKIELPNQMVAVLADPLLQKLMLLRPTVEAEVRVEHWLATCVTCVANSDSVSGELIDLVEPVHGYVVTTRNFPPILYAFFAQLLPLWDGKDKKVLILEAMSFVPLGDFYETYSSTFVRLQDALLNNSPEPQLDMLDFYTQVLHNWRISLAAESEESNLDNEEGDGGSTSSQATQKTTTTTQTHEYSMCIATLPDFIQHVAKLVMVILQKVPGTSLQAVSTQAGLLVLNFYEELVAILSLNHDDLCQKVQAVVPPPPMVYILHFSQSAAVASRLYAVLASYKQALEAAMAQRSSKQLPTEERRRVNMFNGFLMDLCNCLWRSRAFSGTDTNAQGCRVALPIVSTLARYVQSVDSDLLLPAVFGLSTSPTLCLQAINFLRELEDAAILPDHVLKNTSAVTDPTKLTLTTIHRRHAGPITQASLAQLERSGGVQVTWAAYRSGLLDYLSDRGLSGVSALMHNTMKNLMHGKMG